MSGSRTVSVERVGRATAALAVLALASFATMVAQAGWRAIQAHPGGAALRSSIAAPASAEWSAEKIAAPTAGTTGTVALPALPSPALGAVSGAVPNEGARPFSLAAASPRDRGRALQCLTAAIYYEAGSEPVDGQRAVAQIVLNRVRHPAFPNTVCGVVYQGSAHGGCQFSFACDGSMRRAPSTAGWTRAVRVAAAALAGAIYAPVGLATHYHTYAVTPAWNRALVMTDVVGAHFFHRWKDWWGTSAAFTQRYSGSEPLPEPIAAVPAPVVAPAAVAPLAAVPTGDIRPAHLASGTPIAAAPDADRLPPASTILDRWRESGRPLR